ncbi:hypothetical protein CSOJ01_04993 [Colletotrichum sojae]|uniref:AAA+ ATPase domain-containing protein n=1 Tax=Colletotrichum sojae TaxID=2175907 RepID=A0A8H6JGI8_9PEZI|nr:hypothetical protein CSOJ01_04993 [Colletotrichum sojae]
MWWYQYRKSQIVERLPPDEAKLLGFLTTWIDENYTDLYDHVDSQLKRGMIPYVSMEFLIKPGDVLVSKTTDGVECQLAISWLQPLPERTLYKVPTAEQTWVWRVHAWSYSYDGVVRKRTRKIEVRLHAAAVEDEVSIADLDTEPLQLLDQNVYATLARRGKTFWACRKRKLVSYTDEASDLSCARFMVDCHTYKKIHPDSAFEMKSVQMLGTEMPKAVFDCEEPPKEPELLLLPNEVTGFELRRKKWKKLKVDQIQEVSWNRQAFDHLVATSDTKEIIQALITNQLTSEMGTDVIANKGNGLIMLLHGGPGTGKTFTAESVAEMAGRPLYPVTCGDIGTKPEQVEAYLESVFHLGKLWGCVVLLDEAEVFLEQRTLSDLDRNALVSVSLRALEYYEGILILTSNRVGTFDEVFKSRIQLALHYKSLQKPQRRQIWKNFFDRLDSMGESRIDFANVEKHLDRLSEYQMNGRQLTQYKDETMMFTHLRHAIEVTGEFDKYLEGVHRGCADEEIAREEGVS